ncbi:hypothetical protein, partial [Blautia wexlerae]|uniref:hypothetical protein n=1 Tax=Blautia wexlerae TaxID=418240 RepID=UPI0034A241B9
LLPARFSYDEGKIQAIAQGRDLADGDGSFQVVGEIYRWSGLAEMPTTAGLIGFASFCVMLFVVARPGRMARARFVDWLLVCGVVVLGAVYLGDYSKDVFVLLVVAVFVFAPERGRLGELLPLVALLAYAELFRTYWYLIAAAYVALRLLLLVARSFWVVLLECLLLLAVLAVCFAVVLGVPLDYYRQHVNAERTADSTGSLIDGVIPGNSLLAGYVNSAYVLANFVVPITLIVRGSVLYLLVGAFLAILWITFGVRVDRGLKIAALRAPQLRAVAIVLAFTLVQSAFEPDFGSYVRHATPMLILVLYVILSAPRRAADSALEGAVVQTRNGALG